ncbi:peroxisome assembly protein 12 [Condylostylus longicornis]|uniref:peroxisome assembly protein 12 n=1 Tax=Condylostylus longicornis TaxID=2530218 RepID=UPI00244E1A69|nr:peroxisome assembly protein 12 [Condylostylus longicornis]
MAESVTFTANLHYLPSIFEVTASEFLDSVLYPALSKICDFLGLKFAIKNKYIKFSDDVSPAISLALQYFYLKKRDASFGESFYGLQRITRNDTSLKMHFHSALLLVLLPYLEKKLKTRAANHENRNIMEKLLLNGIYFLQILKAINILTYLVKISSTHSPIFHILGLKLSYSQGTEERATSIILKSVEFFAFFLQFMQWWYIRPESNNIGNLKNPPCFKNTEINILALNNKNECPICLQIPSIPTASGISGYVFCWKCIATHLENRKICPVTSLPMNINDLIRIYDN